MNILPGNMRFGAGQPVKRLEDQRLLTGKGQFIDDKPDEGALWLYVLRWPMLTPGSSRSTPGWPNSRLRLAFTFLRSTRAVARLGAAARLPAGGGLRIICRRFAIDARHPTKKIAAYLIQSGCA